MRFNTKRDLLLALLLVAACDSIDSNPGDTGQVALENQPNQLVNVVELAPDGSTIREFSTSQPDTIRPSQVVQGAGKVLDYPNTPWVNYVIYPSANGASFSNLGNFNLQVTFPDQVDGAATNFSETVDVIFHDLNASLQAPTIVSQSGVVGGLSSTTSSSYYPGPSGNAGITRQGPRTYNACDPYWDWPSSTMEWDVKDRNTLGTWSEVYTMTLVKGDCVLPVDHAPGYPTGGFTKTGSNSYAVTNPGFSYFGFTSQFTTHDGRYYDVDITSASCDVANQVGYPAIQNNQVSFSVNMTGLSAGQKATCTVTVEDDITSDSETFTYEITDI